jgi:hypothetical protein
LKASPGEVVTPQRVGRIIWRRKLVCCVVAAIVAGAGCGWLLSRPKTYQSTATVALLPDATNTGVLPNYPNLIASLIPTYVQLVSSPVLLDQVAAALPFPVTETRLAAEVHAESMSSAAVISIVVDDVNPVRAQEIAATATAAFLARLRGNGVVVPQVYGRPVVPGKPYALNLRLTLAVLVALALICGGAAGLAWDRLRGPPAAATVRPLPRPDGPAADSPAAPGEMPAAAGAPIFDGSPAAGSPLPAGDRPAAG